MVEATGVYYEELTYFLADNQQLLSVLLPNKAKHFARSTELKSKTDQLDARLRCRLGLERALPASLPYVICAPWPANGKCWCAKPRSSRFGPTPTSLASNPIAGR